MDYKGLRLNTSFYVYSGKYTYTNVEDEDKNDIECLGSIRLYCKFDELTAMMNAVISIAESYEAIVSSDGIVFPDDGKAKIFIEDVSGKYAKPENDHGAYIEVEF